MDEDNKTKKDDEIDLKEISRIFIKRKWWFIGAVIIILAIGLVYIFMQPSNYLLTYQLKLKENYTNNNLSVLYPNYEKELNYISLKNIPVIFKSDYGFESLDGLSLEDINYNELRKSESVKVSLIENTSLFNISVSYPDYYLADKIAKTLISEFENSIRNTEKTILNNIAGKINQDIKDIESKNDNYLNTIIANLEDELDSLYLELNRYIIEYNVGLFDELDKNNKTENVSFYNVVIPPNAISYKISALQAEATLYKLKIKENKDKILSLNNLHGSLLEDENTILDRVILESEKPLVEINSNKGVRHIAILLLLSLLAGAIVVFIVNFGFNLKKRKGTKP